MAIRTPKCFHFGSSSSKTVRFWDTDCHGATPLAMTVLVQIAFFDNLYSPVPFWNGAVIHCAYSSAHSRTAVRAFSSSRSVTSRSMVLGSLLR